MIFATRGKLARSGEIFLGLRGCAIGKDAAKESCSAQDSSPQ